MPTLVQLTGNLKICMYADDHNPPHFHVVGGEIGFTIRIDTLQILRGRANAQAFAQAVTWATGNRALLAQKWSELNERD